MQEEFDDDVLVEKICRAIHYSAQVLAPTVTPDGDFEDTHEGSQEWYFDRVIYVADNPETTAKELKIMSVTGQEQVTLSQEEELFLNLFISIAKTALGKEQCSPGLNGFNRDQIVKFGEYLLSDERREYFKRNPLFPNEAQLESRLKQVHHADVENFLDMFMED